MWRLLKILFTVTIAVCSSILAAQKPQQPILLRFEAAAIRPGDPGLREMSSTSTTGLTGGGTYRMVNCPLLQWVQIGLSAPSYALKAPPWLAVSRYDLSAKLPNEPVDSTAVPQMVQNLLVERFGLKWHVEDGVVAGYELVVDKKILMQPATMLERLKGRATGSGPTVINGKNIPMSELATLLGKALRRPVVDATQLTDGYDVQLRWRADDDAGVTEQRKYEKQGGYEVDNLPGSLFTAVREQLGLRLQKAKVPYKVTVIDQINRQPTAN